MTDGNRRLVAVALLLAVGTPARTRAAAVGAAPLADEPTLIALAVSLACADAAEVSPGVTPATPPDATGPEIELVATIRARSLRFDAVPKGNVDLRGSKRRTVWKTERVNLPAHPEPGVVYRDVQLRLTVTSTAEEMASLIAEAERAAKGIRIDDAAPLVAIPALPVSPAAVAAADPKPAPEPKPSTSTSTTPTGTPTPTSTPTAIPTATPTAIPTALPTPTPTATATPTATPTAPPTPIAIPASDPAPAAPPAPAAAH